MDIGFTKLSGSGNDFICIDNRDARFDDLISSGNDIGRFAKTLCRRGLGVGADGVIFACQPEIEGVADIAARFFEADGSEVELCGNGTGCFVHWVMTNGWLGPGEIKILTPAGVVRGSDSGNNYSRVCIPLPEGLQMNIDLQVNGEVFECDYVVTGVPHTVCRVDDLARLDVQKFGRLFRHHPAFAPRGVNANFVQVLGEGDIAVRTYEFGVEGETLACGTGSASAAIITALREKWGDDYRLGRKPVLVHARGGDVLRIYFTADQQDSIVDVCLETRVRLIYTGVLGPDMMQALEPGPESSS